MSERQLLEDKQLRRFLNDELMSIRRYALSMTGSVDDADDMVQATMEKVLISGLPVEAPKAWLVRVCRNLWIDELRKRKVRDHDEYIEEGEGTVRPVDVVVAPVESEIEKAQRFESIGKALDELTEEHRDILSLVVVEGLSYAQVAETLELPVGTVMSRVARARTNLRKKIAEFS